MFRRKKKHQMVPDQVDVWFGKFVKLSEYIDAREAYLIQRSFRDNYQNFSDHVNHVLHLNGFNTIEEAIAKINEQGEYVAGLKSVLRDIGKAAEAAGGSGELRDYECPKHDKGNGPCYCDPDLTIGGRETPEPETVFYKALGWMLAECCSALDRGEDPRGKEIPDMVHRAEEAILDVHGPRSQFPDRDKSKPAEEQGIFNKFFVRRTDGSDLPGGKHEGCRYFVLDMDCDPFARPALRAYAFNCRPTHRALSDELFQFVGDTAAVGKARTIDNMQEDISSLISHAAVLHRALRKGEEFIDSGDWDKLPKHLKEDIEQEIRRQELAGTIG